MSPSATQRIRCPAVDCAAISERATRCVGGTRRKTHHTRDDARRGVFDYTEIFYIPKCKHTNNGMLSPVVLDNQTAETEQGKCLGNQRHLN